MRQKRFLHELEQFDIIKSDGGYPDYESIIVLPYCGWGDYVGGSASRSNYIDMMAEFGHLRWFHDKLQGYGSHELALVVKYLPQRSPHYDTILEWMEDLQEYPLLSDDTHSELENEVIEEEFGSWIWHDLIHAVSKLDADKAEELEALDLDSEPDWQSALSLFWSACNAANEYPYMEDAVSVYVDVDKLAEKMVEDKEQRNED